MSVNHDMKHECSSCHELKLESDFFVRKNGSRRRQCKACLYKQNRKNYNHEKERFRKLKSAFGIEKEDFERMNAEQDGKCAICGNAPTVHARNRGVLCVDHDHKTNKIRALLCRPCNQGLGLFYDNKELMVKAIQYLDKHSND